MLAGEKLNFWFTEEQRQKTKVTTMSLLPSHPSPGGIWDSVELNLQTMAHVATKGCLSG